MIRAVLFDVGGPLNTEVAHEAAVDACIRAGLAVEGCVVDDEAYAAAERWAVDSFAPSLYRAIIWRLTGEDAAKAQRVSAALEAGAPQRTALFQLREGIPEVLETLRVRGLKLGLAANQPARIVQELEAHGIGHYFASNAVTGVYGFQKPDVRLFLRACEDLEIVPDECVMVGDRIDNDVVPARLLGMRTVLMRTGRHIKQQPRSWDERPDAEVHTTAELLPAILSLVDGTP
jgi:HAD superfamily hydrolase (TIGR01549 family)